MNNIKYKIIHVMNHLPPYTEYANKPRPAINWNTPNGSWVGIWGYDWSDQMSSEVLNISDEFEHEVWQPDLRADKIYSHTFINGLKHRMFPAIEKFNKEITSSMMLSFLSDGNIEFRYIFHLTYPHYLGLNKDLLDTYKNSKFIVTFHGEIDLPLNALFRMQRNPIKKIIYLKQHFIAKRYFRLVNHVTFMNSKNLNRLKKYYLGDLTKMTMGINTSKFKVLDKKYYKKKLNLPDNKKVLLTVSRLNSHKQVERLIEILNEIDDNFVYVVIGHGEIQYENILRKKAIPLMKTNKIRFEGYKRGDELIEYLNAADLFILVSKNEGASVAVMEAMACGLPIFCTDTGNTAEVLKENNAGMVVGISNYKEWKKKMVYCLGDNPVKVLDIEIVRKHYDWENVAKKLITIYRSII